MQSICKVAECANIVRTKGYCGKHWLRLIRNGDINTVRHIAKYADNATCLIDQCSNKPLAKNLCKNHYQIENKKIKGFCQQENCKNKVSASGLCSNHYAILRSSKNGICKIEECNENVRVKKYGYCNQHYVMFRKHGDPLAGAYRLPHKKALDNSDGTRTCTKCGKSLSKDNFHKDKTATGGIRAMCKKCRISHVTNWYQDNRERQSGKEKKRRLDNHEKYAEKEAIRYIRDREKRIILATEHSHRRKARKLKTVIEKGISKKSLKKIFGTQCYYCKKEMDFSVAVGRKFNKDMATIEHLIPLARGGEHTWENTVLACRHCNISKNAKSIEEFEEFNKSD